jgi:hypothetical protein
VVQPSRLPEQARRLHHKLVEAMPKTYFVSDLHLFANRSNAHQYLEEIARAAARVQVSAVGTMTAQWRTLVDSLGGGDPRRTVGGFSDLCRANGYRR